MPGLSLQGSDGPAVRRRADVEVNERRRNGEGDRDGAGRWFRDEWGLRGGSEGMVLLGSKAMEV